MQISLMHGVLQLHNYARLVVFVSDYVELDPKYLRPAEVDLLIGDAAKAKRELGWEPKVAFKELVSLMVDADLAMVSQPDHEMFGDTDSAGSAPSVLM